MVEINNKLLKITVFLYTLSIVLLQGMLLIEVDVNSLIYLIPYLVMLFVVDRNNRQLNDETFDYFKDKRFIALHLGLTLLLLFVYNIEIPQNEIGQIFALQILFMLSGFYVANALKRFRLRRG